MVVENFVLTLTAAMFSGSAHAYMTSNDLDFKIYEDHFGKPGIQICCWVPRISIFTPKVAKNSTRMKINKF